MFFSSGGESVGLNDLLNPGESASFDLAVACHVVCVVISVNGSVVGSAAVAGGEKGHKRGITKIHAITLIIITITA